MAGAGTPQVHEDVTARPRTLSTISLDGAAELIEDSCYPNELLQVWDETEAQLQVRKREERESLQVWLLRLACTGFIGQLVEHMRLPAGSFSQAVALLDIYCHRADVDEEKARLLPGVCTAICNILFKADQADILPDTASLAKAEKWFGQHLRENGWLTENDDEGLSQDREVKSLHKKELEILEILEWQVGVPTVATWLSAFCARLNLATQGTLTPSLDFILQRGAILGNAVLLSTTAFQFTPKRLAHGVMCLGFVAAGLLPLAVFRPPGIIDHAGFGDLCAGALGMAMPECRMPEVRRPTMLSFLMLATCASLEELRTACLATAIEANIGDNIGVILRSP